MCINNKKIINIVLNFKNNNQQNNKLSHLKNTRYLF